MKTVVAVRHDYQIVFSQPEPLSASLPSTTAARIEDSCGESLQQAQSIVRAGTSDDRDRGDISRLVAKSNAQPDCEKKWKSKDPENNFRLALEFQ